MNAPTNAVTVAVGPGNIDAALAFAATEARRTGRPLHLIHVLQLPPGQLPASDAYVGVLGGVLDLARATLDEALQKSESLVGEAVPVTGELVDHGRVADILVGHTQDASCLVLQHRALSTVRRVFTGSTTQRVSGRAHVPVVSVPEGWVPKDDSSVVTAAVQDPGEAPALLRLAFEEARSRGVGLVVLHAWWLDSGYDVVAVDDAYRAEQAARSGEELATVLRPLEREFPDVRVEITVRHVPPAEALLDAGEVSDLLVIGRRHHLLPPRTHLGPIARSTLGHASCPVLVVPEPDPSAGSPQDTADETVETTAETAGAQL